MTDLAKSSQKPSNRYKECPSLTQWNCGPGKQGAKQSTAASGDSPDTAPAEYLEVRECLQADVKSPQDSDATAMVALRYRFCSAKNCRIDMLSNSNVTLGKTLLEGVKRVLRYFTLFDAEVSQVLHFVQGGKPLGRHSR